MEVDPFGCRGYNVSVRVCVWVCGWWQDRIWEPLNKYFIVYHRPPSWYGNPSVVVVGREGGTVGSPPSHEEAMITRRTNSYNIQPCPWMGVYVVGGGEGCSASDDVGECARGRVVEDECTYYICSKSSSNSSPMAKRGGGENRGSSVDVE